MTSDEKGYLTSKVSNVKNYLSSRAGPFILGAIIVGGFSLFNSSPSNVIASSPDRIIPSAIEKNITMADGALNLDLFEARICNADPDQTGYETVFVMYRNEEDKAKGKNEMRLLASVVDGSSVFTPYEGEDWRCRRPRF